MNDEEFLRAFEGAGLSREAWTHRAHVRVAYLYLRRHELGEAIGVVRAGIKKLNAAHGTPETPTRGYNETTTVAFMHIIAAVMGAYGEVFPTEDSEAFCERHPQLMSPQILRLFYSPRRRMDERAKGEFLAPDLTALPRVVGKGDLA